MSASTPIIVASVPKTKKKKQKQGQQLIVSPNAVAYNGSMSVPLSKLANDVVTVDFKTTSSLSFTSATPGVMAAVFITSDFTSDTEFSSYYINLFSEYRVLGMKLQFEPTNLQHEIASSNTLIHYGPVATAVDHSSSVSTPTSYQSVFNYSSSQLMSLLRPFSREWKMSGTDEADFIVIGSSATRGGIVLYAATDLINATTATVGRVLLTTRVQFRGEK